MTKGINFGKYLRMPATFKKLKKVEEILEKEGYSLERDCGLILQSDHLTYHCIME